MGRVCVAEGIQFSEGVGGERGRGGVGAGGRGWDGGCVVCDGGGGGNGGWGYEVEQLLGVRVCWGGRVGVGEEGAGLELVGGEGGYVLCGV